MFKVMIRDGMSLVAKEILESTGLIEATVDFDKANSAPEVLAEILKDYDGLAVRSGTKVPESVLEACPNLKVIGRAGIGVDNIDVPAATRHGVVVMNAPGGNTVTTGEHTISLMLSLARNIPQATASLRAGRWDKKSLSGVEIMGKTLGIIGLGNIGRVVAERAVGLKMKVIAADPFVSKEAAKALHVELVEKDDLYGRSDFISLHVPRLAETVNMINAESMAKMKKGVRIVNCSRGNIVDIDALYAALEAGQVAGAALDVFPREPPPADLPILQHPRVIFTPHLGASTSEAQTKVAEMIGHQMAAYLISEVITNAVNFPSVSKEVMDQLRPYLVLAQSLGSLMGQLVREKRDVAITYTGNTSHLDTRPLTNAVLKGLLSAYTDKPVNHVSAPAIARDKGIKVDVNSTAESDHYAGTIRVALKGVENGPCEAWGAIFGTDIPRIVKVGDVHLDAIPKGYMILIKNIDKPGVIGNVGSLLGRHDINIGRFQLGRRNGRAVCIVNIDSQAPEEVLEQLRKLPNILTVTQVHL